MHLLECRENQLTGDAERIPMSLDRVRKYPEQSGPESRMTVYPGTINTVGIRMG